MSWELRNADAMDLLASLPDRAADATITDPPYGTTANAWDEAPDWPALMAELLRVTRGAVCVFSQMPVAVDVVRAAREKFRYQIVWRKSQPQGFLDANRKPLRAHEVILVFCARGYGEYHPQMTAGAPYAHGAGANSGRCYHGHKPAFTLNEGVRYPTDVQDFANAERTTHATEKPVDLLRWLVRTYTAPGGGGAGPLHRQRQLRRGVRPGGPLLRGVRAGLRLPPQGVRADPILLRAREAVLMDGHRPCPWCGDASPRAGTHEYRDPGPGETGAVATMWCIDCLECGATGPAEATEEAAWDRWDSLDCAVRRPGRRPRPTPAPAQGVLF